MDTAVWASSAEQQIIDCTDSAERRSAQKVALGVLASLLNPGGGKSVLDKCYLAFAKNWGENEVFDSMLVFKLGWASMQYCILNWSCTG